jgi:2-methylcitrate dehydratase PrpD
MEADPKLEDTPGGGRPCRVTIHLKDGRSLFRQVDHAKGSPEAPFSPEELREKFLDCARRALGEAESNDALRLLDRLDTLESVAPLSTLLMGDPGGSAASRHAVTSATKG